MENKSKRRWKKVNKKESANGLNVFDKGFCS